MPGLNTISRGPKEGEIEMTIRQRLQQFASYRRTLRELNKLDSHQLNDLGIAREDIAAIARGETK